MTNLNEAFWRWFGNSTIRHEDGTPKIVYHGTRSPVDFDVFRTGSIFDEEEDELLVSGSNDASAFLGPHFTESLQLATKFAEGKAASWDRSRYIHKEGKGRVIPVYLRIENPKVFENDDEVWNFIWKYGESRELDDFFELHEIEQISTNIWYDPEEEQRYTTAELNERFFFETSDESEYGHSPRETAAEELGTSARDALIKLGHDGIVYLNTVEGGGHSYVVFEANQIKSADRNVGTWDRENDSILAGASISAPQGLPSVVLPKGSQLFHGSIEDIEGELRPGGYDSVLWFADMAGIAQLYIPRSGGELFTSSGNIAKPSEDPSIHAIQRLIDLNYDYNRVEWDDYGRLKSYPVPPGWEELDPNIEYNREAERRLAKLGFKGDGMEGWKTYRFRFHKGRLLPPDESVQGQLCVAVAQRDLVLWNKSLGEGDLTNVQYHDLKGFRKAFELGYDGVMIDDFAQSEDWGNIGHMSVGVFAPTVASLDIRCVPATYEEYNNRSFKTKAWPHETKPYFHKLK
jgi:hypothetical protein